MRLPSEDNPRFAQYVAAECGVYVLHIGDRSLIRLNRTYCPGSVNDKYVNSRDELNVSDRFSRLAEQYWPLTIRILRLCVEASALSSVRRVALSFVASSLTPGTLRARSSSAE